MGKSDLFSREQYYFDLYHPTYNISETAGITNTRGKSLSQEHIAKISQALKGRIVSEETRARLSAAKKGVLNPRWGIIPSEEERSASRTRMIENNPMYGKGKPVFLWLSDKRTKLASYRSVYQASKGLSADRRSINTRQPK